MTIPVAYFPAMLGVLHISSSLAQQCPASAYKFNHLDKQRTQREQYQQQSKYSKPKSTRITLYPIITFSLQLLCSLCFHKIASPLKQQLVLQYPRAVSHNIFFQLCKLSWLGLGKQSVKTGDLN